MNLDKRVIATLVLGAVAIGLFLVVQFVDLGKQDEESEETDLPEPLFANSETAAVVSIEVVDNETGTIFRAAKSESGTWTIQEAPEGSDTGLGVDEMTLTGPLYGLPSIRPSRVLDEVESLAIYGLEQASHTIRFQTDDGGDYTLNIGATNPGGSAYYVQIPNDPRVYLIPKYNLETLIGFIENPPYIQPTPDPNATPTEEATGQDS